MSKAEPSARFAQQALLAYVTSNDIDGVEFQDSSVTLHGQVPVTASWAVLSRALLAGALVTPDKPLLDLGLLGYRWLLARAWLARPVELMRNDLRVLGMAAKHPLHPGQDWVVEPVHGASLHLGWGAEGVDPSTPDVVLPLPPTAWADADIDPAAWWPRARWRQEQAAELCALRYASGSFGPGKIRPIGGHDIPTLLGARALREPLAALSDAGMASVAVPERQEGLIMTRRVDPAFANVLASAASVTEVGFEHPVLVTRDEVVLMPPVGDVVAQAFADPLPPEVLGGTPSPYFT